MPTRRPEHTEALLDLLDAVLALAHQQLDQDQVDAAAHVLALARGLLVLDEPLDLRVDAFNRAALTAAEDYPHLAAELGEVLDQVAELGEDEGHGCADPERPCRWCRSGVECPSPGCETVELDPDVDEHGPF